MGINAITIGIWSASGSTSGSSGGSGSTDEYWSNVSVLLTGDDLLDSSSNGLTLSNTGLTVDTATKKYGSGSLYCNGSSYAEIATTSLLSMYQNDFTHEFWINSESLSAATTPLDVYYSSYYYVQLIILTSGIVRFSVRTGGVFLTISSTSAIAVGAFAHVALTKSGTTLRLFLNGVLQASSTVTNLFTYNCKLVIGRSGGGSGYFTGYLDDIRITNGVARYTSDFTPPDHAFPNS